MIFKIVLSIIALIIFVYLGYKLMTGDWNFGGKPDNLEIFECKVKKNNINDLWYGYCGDQIITEGYNSKYLCKRRIIKYIKDEHNSKLSETFYIYSNGRQIKH